MIAAALLSVSALIAIVVAEFLTAIEARDGASLLYVLAVVLICAAAVLAALGFVEAQR